MERNDGLVAIESNIRPDLGYVLIGEKDFDPTKHRRFDPNPPTPELKPPPVDAIEDKPKSPRKPVKEVISDAG